MDVINKSDLKENLISNFKTFESTLKGKNNAVVSKKRKEAFNIFEELGFPTTKNEEWKYTNIAPAFKKDFSIDAKGSLAKNDLSPFLFKGLDANILVFVNGYFSKELSTIISPESSIIIKSFSEADPDLLEKYLNKNLTVNDAFTYLNTAYAHNGSFIQIQKGKVVDKPVIFHFISDARSENIFSQPRNLFIAEENSSVKIIEAYNTLGDHSSFTNVVTEVVLKQDANVEYYKIQNESPEAYHIGTTQVYQEGKSHFSSATVSLSGAIIRNNLNIILNTEYSEAMMYGLYVLDNNQHIDNHTIVDHAKPNCYSNELYKGILGGKATGVFNGKIFVKPDAQKTNAFQSNKNILLSNDATMNTKPQLEIFADDVKCSHGATIGKLDEEPLFYLRSRGISEENAKALLVMAFAQDVIDHIKIEPLKEYLLKVISQKLGQ
jgi:Fe-S cluster assembly protein SufD